MRIQADEAFLYHPLRFSLASEEKLILYGSKGGTGAGDYTIGIESSTMYFRSGSVYRWYINSQSDHGTSDYLELTSTYLNNQTGIYGIKPSSDSFYSLWGTSYSYAIGMSQTSDATYGGAILGGSDYNNYFNMSGNGLRGWVFKSNNNPVFQIRGDGNFAVKNIAPTMYLYDTSDNTLFAIHNNAKRLYFLTNYSDGTMNWKAPYPLQLDNTTQKAETYGKEILASSSLTLTETSAEVLLENTLDTLTIKNTFNSGRVLIQAHLSGTTSNCIMARQNSTTLFAYGSTKLVTSSSGITVYGTVSSSSDPKLKKNVELLSNCLEDVETINYTKFDWKENDQPGVGIDLNTLPEHLKPPLMGETTDPETEETTLNFNYSNFVAVVGQAVKELSKKLEALENRIENLERI